jgi:hypothetical protein
MPPMSSLGPPLALDYFTHRTQSVYDSQADESSVSSSFVDRAPESPLQQLMLTASRPDPSRLTHRLNNALSPIASREPSRNQSASLSPDSKYPHSGSDNEDDEDDEDSDPTPRRTPIKVSKHSHIPMSDCPPTETSSLLLGTCPQSYSTLPAPSHFAPQRSLRKRARAAWTTVTDGAKTVSRPSYIAHLGLRITSLLPAVFLGLLLNVLDGVSYGMILFPPVAIFDGFGPMGVSLFFVTCVFSLLLPASFLILAPGSPHRRTIIAQLVFTSGGSGFAGGIGRMMIEIVVRLLQSPPLPAILPES